MHLQSYNWLIKKLTSATNIIIGILYTYNTYILTTYLYPDAKKICWYNILTAAIIFYKLNLKDYWTWKFNINLF